MATEIEALTTESGLHITPTTPGGPIADPPAPSPEQEEVREKPRSAHERQMEAIYNRSRERLAKEIAYGVEREALQAEDEGGEAEPAERGDGAEPPLPPRRDAAGRFAPVAEPVPPQQQAPAPAPAAQPQLFPLDRGDGQQIWVTADQLVGLARDGIVARVAVDRHQQAPQQQPQQQQPQQQQPASRQPDGSEIAPEKTEDYFKRLTYGDATEGGKALAELANEAVRMARQSQPDPAALANWAADQALRRMRFEQDIITIGQEFPEVFSDETLTQVAALKVGALRQQAAMLRVQKPDLALYRDACGAVMDALKGPNWRQPATERGSEAPPATQAASTVAVVSPAKLERKRAAPQQPTAVGRVASDDATKPWEGRRSDIVEQMRRTRGQSSMR